MEKGRRTTVGLELGRYFSVQLSSLQINSFACTSCRLHVFLTTQFWRHEQDWKKRDNTTKLSWVLGDATCGPIRSTCSEKHSSEKRSLKLILNVSECEFKYKGVKVTSNPVKREKESVCKCNLFARLQTLADEWSLTKLR